MTDKQINTCRILADSDSTRHDLSPDDRAAVAAALVEIVRMEAVCRDVLEMLDGPGWAIAEWHGVRSRLRAALDLPESEATG